MDYKKVIDAQQRNDKLILIGILISVFALGFLTAKIIESCGGS